MLPPKAHEIPGVKIFRFEAPLYFANVDHFRRSLVEKTGLDAKELQRIQEAVKEHDMTLRHEQVTTWLGRRWLASANKIKGKIYAISTLSNFIAA